MNQNKQTFACSHCKKEFESVYDVMAHIWINHLHQDMYMARTTQEELVMSYEHRFQVPKKWSN